MALRSTRLSGVIGCLVLLAVALVLPVPSGASDLVFGPQTCQRGTGAPTLLSYSFAAPGPAGGYILKVYNGGLEDATYELVSSSTITLNGVVILDSSNFNQNVGYLEAPVTLQGQNTLSVEVRGKPGGAMIIKVYPYVVIDAPAEGQVLGTQPTTVSGHLYSTATSVLVNGLPASLSGGSFTISGVPLEEGANTLTAIATRAGGFVGTDSVHVTLDSVAPVVTIQHPLLAAALREPNLAVVAPCET